MKSPAPDHEGLAALLQEQAVADAGREYSNDHAARRARSKNLHARRMALEIRIGRDPRNAPEALWDQLNSINAEIHDHKIGVAMLVLEQIKTAESVDSLRSRIALKLVGAL